MQFQKFKFSNLTGMAMEFWFLVILFFLVYKLSSQEIECDDLVCTVQ